MKVIKGHLTDTHKRAIKTMLNMGLNEAKINRINYFLSKNEKVYTVNIVQKDRGLIPVSGAKLRLSTYTSKFVL